MSNNINIESVLNSELENIKERRMKGLKLGTNQEVHIMDARRFLLGKYLEQYVPEEIVKKQHQEVTDRGERLYPKYNYCGDYVNLKTKEEFLEVVGVMVSVPSKMNYEEYKDVYFKFLDNIVNKVRLDNNMDSMELSAKITEVYEQNYCLESMSKNK